MGDYTEHLFKVAGLLSAEQLANVFLNVEELIQVNERFVKTSVSFFKSYSFLTFLSYFFFPIPSSLFSSVFIFFYNYFLLSPPNQLKETLFWPKHLILLPGPI